MIDIQNINFKYAGSKEQIFSDFSLQLNENNIYGLLGKNGTGKSTLLYLISGLLHPQGGTVTVDGYASRERRPEMLEEIFIVPEEFELPAMTLDEYVRINQPFYPRFSREVLRSCLEDFDLPTSLKLQSLSMGQKKKVFMSFALAAGTRLLLMDEPTNGLDIPSKSQFRKVVAECMTDNRTIIISTHQVRDVENLIDNVTIMGSRQLLFDMPVAQICDHLTFVDCKLGQEPEGAIYSQPSALGSAVVCSRKAGDDETPLDIELLFNAVLANAESVSQAFAAK